MDNKHQLLAQFFQNYRNLLMKQKSAHALHFDMLPLDVPSEKVDHAPTYIQFDFQAR